MATWMKKDGTVRKTIYHSYLKNKGRITIRFTQEPRVSDYDGNPPYCRFQVAGDPEVYSLQIASDSVQAQIEAMPLDTWLECEASGDDREGTASISLKPAQGVVQETLAPSRGTRKPAPAGGAPAGSYAKEPYPWPTIGNSYRDAILVAMDVVSTTMNPVDVGIDMTQMEYAQLIREYAASMLYRQESLWKSTGRWVPLASDSADAPVETEQPEMRATLEAIGDMAELFGTLEDSLAEGPEKTAIQKLIAKAPDVTVGAVEKCMAYLRSEADRIEALKADFSDDALAGDDDLPF